MTVGILGCGFGLYGYLPALARMGEHVVMPKRYRDKLRSRPDVSSLDTRVDWVADDEAVLDRSAALVVSRRPTDQIRNVTAALERGIAKRFLLEKPLGPDPGSALALFDALERDGRAMRLGFIFAYAPWMQKLREWLARVGEDAALTIDWRFRAHHYAAGYETWKRRPSQGGGALRFYGIHLIALLAELGYKDALSSSLMSSSHDEAEAWRATFMGAGRPNCRLRVDSDADDSAFELIGTGARVDLAIRLRDPFDQLPTSDGCDRRVDALIELCGSLLAGDATPPSWYRASLALWAIAERQARHPVVTHAPMD